MNPAWLSTLTPDAIATSNLGLTLLRNVDHALSMAASHLHNDADLSQTFLSVVEGLSTSASKVQILPEVLERTIGMFDIVVSALGFSNGGGNFSRISVYMEKPDQVNVSVTSKKFTPSVNKRMATSMFTILSNVVTMGETIKDVSVTPLDSCRAFYWMKSQLPGTVFQLLRDDVADQSTAKTVSTNNFVLTAHRLSLKFPTVLTPRLGLSFTINPQADDAERFVSLILLRFTFP